ncbi:MAG: 50S ribosomal protein L10 [Alphaproteobacteria bacterium]|nr:50S ribosomal protein L10 [Alphaproteobacteria bacterium]
MEKAKKKELIDSMNASFGEAGIVIVSHYKGLTVAQADELRGKVRAAGATYKVTKNRLTKLALAGTSYEQLGELFTGPTAVAYANDDPVSVSKALTEFAKKNEAFVILGGALGSTALKPKDIEALATLPSLDEVRAKLVGLLNAPATRIAGVLQAPGGQVARVIGAHARQG